MGVGIRGPGVGTSMGDAGDVVLVGGEEGVGVLVGSVVGAGASVFTGCAVGAGPAVGTIVGPIVGTIVVTAGGSISGVAVSGVVSGVAVTSGTPVGSSAGSTVGSTAGATAGACSARAAATAACTVASMSGAFSGSRVGDGAGAGAGAGFVPQPLTSASASKANKLSERAYTVRRALRRIVNRIGGYLKGLKYCKVQVLREYKDTLSMLLNASAFTPSFLRKQEPKTLWTEVPAFAGTTGRGRNDG